MPVEVVMHSSTAEQKSARPAPPKVLIVCPAGIVSGKEIISLALARGLRAKGWDPEFVTSSWNDGDFIRRLESEELKYTLLRLGFISISPHLKQLAMSIEQLRHWPTLIARYLRLTAQTSPELVIHTNWHHALLLLPFLDMQRDIFWAHETIPCRARERRAFRSIGKRVARLVCVSHAVAATVEAAGIPRSKITVIHNGSPSRTTLPSPANNFGLRLGIVGQIGAWKGHDDIIEALAILLRKGRKVTLRVFGTGAPDYIERLMRRASNLDIANSIEWCGFVARHEEIFSAIDVCVVPSRFDEPFGMSALEAGSFGRPVIGSSRGGLPEIIEHGLTGFLVEPERPDQLADAIDILAQDPDLVLRMGGAAQKRAEMNFSSARFVQLFIDLFDQIKNGSPATIGTHERIVRVADCQ
jgi:glycosyltransferase involved in cell wall biosynthesis